MLIFDLGILIDNCSFMENINLEEYLINLFNPTQRNNLAQIQNSFFINNSIKYGIFTVTENYDL